MNPATLPFLLPLVPPRNNTHLKTTNPRISATASPAQDQWEQFESSNKQNRMRQLQIVRDVANRDRHHQIFLTKSSKPMLISASNRFMQTTRHRFLHSRHQSEKQKKRLWLVEPIADHTFGSLRGDPHPPRLVVMESIDRLAHEQPHQQHIDTVVSQWTKALNRAGNALSTFENYSVNYAVWGGASTFGNFYQLQPGYLVACEVLNASWNTPQAVDHMRQLLLSYAQQSVDSGKVAMYQVLQSMDEPTMFKTVEVYACMDHLREHMQTMDPEFAETAKKHRAAVSRVRQLHRCVDTLHSFAHNEQR